MAMTDKCKTSTKAGNVFKKPTPYALSHSQAITRTAGVENVRVEQN